MGWEELIFYVIVAIISYATAPKAKSQPPAAMSADQAPIAEEGKEIPVLFGTRDIAGPNVVWYGDVRTVGVQSDGGKK